MKLVETLYQFRFASGTIEVYALNETEAEILAQAEAIKRGWDYKIIKHNMQQINLLIDWCKLSDEESMQLRRLLLKARATDSSEEEKTN